MSILFEILSKCPLNRNQGPAIEIWSVVHFPLALINSFAPVILFPSQGSNGVRNCNRSEVGSITTSTSLPSSAGAWYPKSFTAKPFSGRSKPVGISNLMASPLSFVSVSVIGLNVKFPAMAMAVTNSGDPTKACVFGFPSARLAKFRLKE